MPEPPPGDDEAFVARALEGDVAAFPELLARHDPALRRLAWHLVHDVATVDEVLGAVYRKAFLGLASRRGGATVQAWLAREAWQGCATPGGGTARARRLRRPGAVVGGPVPELPPELDLAEALAALPRAERAAVLLVDVDGLAPEEGAWVLDVPVGDAAVLLTRARDALRTAASAGTPLLPYDHDGELAHDARLGAALAALAVPDHPPGFWDDLTRSLDELGSRPRAAVGGDPADEPAALATPAEVRASAAATRRATPRSKRQPRHPRPRARARAARGRRRATPTLRPRRGRGAGRGGITSGRRSATVPPLRPRAEGRRRRRRVLAVVALLVVAVAGLAWWAGDDDKEGGGDVLAGASTTTPPPTGAVDPTTPAEPAGTPAHAWQGELTVAVPAGRGRTSTHVWSVVASPGGATRATALDGGTPADVGEDPVLGVRVEVTASGTTRTTGLPPSPIGGEGPDALLRRDVAELVAGLAAAGDPSVAHDEEAGRPVWRWTGEQAPEDDDDEPLQVEALVDRDLLVPLRLVQRRGDAVVLDLGLTVADAEPSAPAGLPEVPAGSGGSGDGGPPGTWRSATLADARLVPASVPAGFEPVAAAVADAAPGGGLEGANPAGRASQVVYQRGWERLVVTVWATGADPAAWADPLAAGAAPPAGSPVVLPSGALEGRTAEVVLQAGAPPHLWAAGPDHVALVSGPLAPDALVAVASSLRPPS